MSALRNTDHPDVGWKPIKLNGGQADVEILPMDLPSNVADSVFNGIVILNDRDYPTDPVVEAVMLEGGGTNCDLRGAVQAPGGTVYINGNSDADLEFTLDRFIAYHYTATAARIWR